MRLLVVNPNTSTTMTSTILSAARATDPGLHVDALCPERGPASVEGRVDEIISAYWALDTVLPVVNEYDGVIVACYSNHPLIGALRELLDQPVLGILEASILQALPLGDRFSIVTTSLRWQPLLEEAVHALGLERRCASVRTTGLSVHEVDTLPDDDVRAHLRRAALAAVEEDGAEVICLGCAGMAGFEAAVAQATGVPVIDGVQAAVWQVRGMVASGASTSKRRLYQRAEYPPAGSGLDMLKRFNGSNGR
jgi:allantoin racemase